MYRTNAQSRALEETFIRYGSPTNWWRDTLLRAQRSKGYYCLSALYPEPSDGVSLQRIINVPGRGIGQRTMSELAGMAKSLNLTESETLQMLTTGKLERLPFNTRIAQSLVSFTAMINELRDKSSQVNLLELFDLVTERSGYKQFLANDKDGEERWENILELRTVAKEYDELPPPPDFPLSWKGSRWWLMSIASTAVSTP